jgi:hypothetical protein
MLSPAFSSFPKHQKYVSMNDTDSVVSAFAAVLLLYAVLETVCTGALLHWIPILAAIAVNAMVARSMNR